MCRSIACEGVFRSHLQGIRHQTLCEYNYFDSSFGLWKSHTHTHQKRKALSLIQDCRNAGLIHLKKQNKYILTLLSNLTLSTLQDVFHWGVKDEAHILKKALFGEKTCVSITGAVQATVHYLYLRQVWAGNCNKHFTEACVLPNHIHSPSFPHARGTFRL